MNTRPDSQRRSLTGFLILALALCLGIAMLAQPGRAAAADAHPGPATPSAKNGKAQAAPPPVGSTAAMSDRSDARRSPIDAAHLPPNRPLTSPTPQKSKSNAARGAAAASCTPGDFGSRTGADLVAFVQASTTDCVNTLFSLTGTNAYNAFREAQMVTIAGALQNTARTYPGDDSTSVWQLVLFLRAGYYVQSNNASDVGPYGPTLATASRGAPWTPSPRPRTSWTSARPTATSWARSSSSPTAPTSRPAT